ncbi:XkdX family protein [Listeria weihenstephanensis]|uniref:XkdX family protein n=1 Tax=Listeria weihenstephanensis TaxID=1006155 RepID=A0A841Z2H0_9LIST|nr:XkdX family protein [Listeria weihenstephanensis]MBC1499415.1 XkdX family protein [Listeria weihenstephanensis]
MDWKAKVESFYLNGNYTEANVQRFVIMEKITQQEADEIIASKQALESEESIE